MGVLEYQLDGHVGLLTLNRPEARNSLNPELIVGLAETWERVKEYPVVRVVVLTGADGSTFCSGFDLGTTIPLITGSREPQNQFEEAIAADREILRRATLVGHDIGKPIVAAVNGHAIAGGMELLLACDLRVVAQGVKLGLSEVALGLIPGMGGTALLRRHLPGALAMEMLLCAKPIISDDLANSGLFNRLVPVSETLPTALEIAQTIASNAPLAVQSARQVVRKSSDLEESEALLLETEIGEVLAKTEDAVEGPLAFMEKRSAKFHGR
jgi:enoyl-CoA hydratase